MYIRVGTKLKFWRSNYKNKPAVVAPGFLKLVSVLSIFSIVGLLIYAVSLTLVGIGHSAIEPEKGIYVAFLHFVLPLGVAITVSTNSPLSRLIILVYSLVLYFATLAGKGVLGELEIAYDVKIFVSTFVLVVVVSWLFFSPKMRLYYALVADRPIPDDLQPRVSELVGKTWLSPKVVAAIEWVVDRLETVLLLGAAIAVIALFAFI